MMKRWTCAALALAALAAAVAADGVEDNLLEAPRIADGERLLGAVAADCFSAASLPDCLKGKTLAYLDGQAGVGAEDGRALRREGLDELLFDRASAVLDRNRFTLQLPEFIFQSARLSYGGRSGFDVHFPDPSTLDEGQSEARGLLKKKLLLPALLLFKLKMKALMPIFVALIGLKAMKALILSKLAIVLVVGFLIVQLMKKGGMMMPMAMMAEAGPPPAYGPPPQPPSSQYGPAASPPSSQYGPAASPPASQYGPAATSPPPAADSYSPSWEPSNPGPYARWDSPASSLAYSAYYPSSSSSASSTSSSSSSQASKSSS